MRVATCVSAVVLLFVTTPQQVLFKSLRSVGVPKIYVLTLEMAYRYIFLLMDMVREMYAAKKARTIKSRSIGDYPPHADGLFGTISDAFKPPSSRIRAFFLPRALM